jgi:sulfite reductase alpha subunit-like flavoprotein
VCVSFLALICVSSYMPGDVLLVHPHNPLQATAQFIQSVLHLDPRSVITITRNTKPASASASASGSSAASASASTGAGAGAAADADSVIRLGSGGDEWVLSGAGTSGSGAARSRTLSVMDLFSVHLDVFGVPRAWFFTCLSLFAAEPREKQRLQELGSAECADELYRYCKREHRSYAEVMSEFPSARPPIEYLLELIPRLQPRQYSISSSPLVCSAPALHCLCCAVLCCVVLRCALSGV